MRKILFLLLLPILTYSQTLVTSGGSATIKSGSGDSSIVNTSNLSYSYNSGFMSRERLKIFNSANPKIVYYKGDASEISVNSSTGLGSLTALDAIIATATSSQNTGWADYTDTTYTSASPFSLTAATKYTLYNHADVIRDSQIPVDVDSVYSRSDSTIIGFNGDGWNILIEFNIKPTTANVTKLSVALDIGGSVGEIYPRDFILTKGNGVEHYYLSSFTAYMLDTWEANGAKVKVQVDNAAEIYDLRYVLTRTHKAR